MITNPETLLEKNGRFLRLLKDPKFLKHVISVIIDEAHCVVNWGTFRPEYKEMGLLRYILPNSIPLYIVSATLPPTVLHDIRRMLHIRDNACEEIMSNDRPNVSIMVRKLAHGQNTYWDLAFLVPLGWKPGDAKPLLFLVMFDSIRILQGALEFLRRRLPKEHRRMILPFHSEMSEEHRIETIKLMKTGSILGVCASEGFGLVSKVYIECVSSSSDEPVQGIDVPHIQLVVQWTARRVDFCTLVQRFGRAARDPGTHGIGLLLAEPACFDDEEEIKRKRKRKEKGKQQAARRKRRKVHTLQHSPQAEAETQSQPDASESDNDDNDDDDDDEVGDTEEGEGRNGDRTDNVPEPGGDGNSHPEPVDLQARWAEYVSWSREQAKVALDNKGFSGYSPPLQDLVGVKKPCLNCRRLAQKLYFTPSKTLGKVITYYIYHIASNCTAALVSKINSAVPTTDCRENGLCPRCEPPPPRLCCDIDSPELLTLLSPVPDRDFIKKPHKSAIKNYMPGDIEAALTKALEEWRFKTAKEWLGEENFRLHGVAALMPDHVLENIVKYASKKKLPTAESLQVQARWRRWQKFGERVLQVVNSFIPQAQDEIVRPLSSSTAQFINFGVESVSFSTIELIA